MHAQLSESGLAVPMPPLVSHPALQVLPILLSSEGHCKHPTWLESAFLGSKSDTAIPEQSAAVWTAMKRARSRPPLAGRAPVRKMYGCGQQRRMRPWRCHEETRLRGSSIRASATQPMLCRSRCATIIQLLSRKLLGVYRSTCGALIVLTRGRVHKDLFLQ